MKSPSLIFLLLLAYSGFTWAAPRSAERDFLEGLGFQNYTREIDKTLEGSELEPSQRVTLLGLRKRYELVDLARELSLGIYNIIKPRLNDPAVEAKSVRLAAQLLRPHSLLSNEILPASITKERDPKTYQALRQDYLFELGTTEFREESAFILTAILDLMNSAGRPVLSSSGQITKVGDVQRLERTLTRYLVAKYEMLEVQNTFYFGRALSALLVRHSRLKHQPNIEADLKDLVIAQEDRLENYLSSTQYIRDRTGKFATASLKSGDFANEYSMGADAFYIAIGVRPGSAANRHMAKEQNLVGSLHSALFFATPNEQEEIMGKYRTNQPLTKGEQRKFQQIKKLDNIKGYSHVGIVVVYRDAESGIEMPWILDIYPSDGVGGMRFIGPEGFAFPERFQKVGYVRYSADKFMTHYHRSIQKYGYRSNIWQSASTVYDDNGQVIDERGPMVDVPTRVSREEVQYLNSFPPSSAQSWYDEQIIPRVLKTMRSYMTSDKVLSFAFGFSNTAGAAYCSQLLALAFLQAVNVDVQSTPDDWIFPVKIAQLLKINFDDYELNQRIVSPSGFAWQADLVQQETHVLLNSKLRPKSMYDTNFSLLQVDPKMRKAVDDLISCQAPLEKDVDIATEDNGYDE
jgi:hypothetical protein